jgi:hypothetical protein
MAAVSSRAATRKLSARTAVQATSVGSSVGSNVQLRPASRARLPMPLLLAPDVNVRVATETVGGRKIAHNLHRFRTPCCTPKVSRARRGERNGSRLPRRSGVATSGVATQGLRTKRGSEARSAFSVGVSLAGIEPVGFRVKSDLRNHQAIVQPRLYDCLIMMVTQITLPTVPSAFKNLDLALPN